MADSNPKPQSIVAKEEEEEEEQQLKHLEFVQIAVLHAIVCFSRLYDCAKDNCGPLKPGVETVQGTVKVVVGPVYEKFHDVPIQLLKFVDRKVDESVVELLDKRFHPLMKKVSIQSRVSASAAAAKKNVRPSLTASGFAKNVFAKYEPVAQHYAVSTWHSLNQLPIFPVVAQLLVPTAAYCSDKYNHTVLNTTEKGYKFASYLPLVPMDKILKLFSTTTQEEQEQEADAAIKPLLQQSGAEQGPVAA